MKHVISILLISLSLPVLAVTLRGSGISPLILHDASLAKWLATLDALSDVLLRSDFQLEGGVLLEQETLKSQQLNLKFESRHIRFLNRSCVKEADSMKCDITVQFVKENLVDGQEAKTKIGQCTSNQGVQFCYQPSQLTSKKYDHYFMTMLEVEEAIIWKTFLGTKKIISKFHQLKGVGKTSESSLKVAQMQLRPSSTMQKKYQQIKLYKEISLDASNFKLKHRSFLTLLGGHFICHGNKCLLLVPYFENRAF